MIKKYFLRTIAALALAFVIAISASPHAQAAAPNSLLVLTGFRAHGGTTITPAVGVAGVATVVNKTTSNGLTIPLSGSPYYGNHFDTNNNGSPDANSILWGTSNNFYGYSYSTMNKLIWCGNSGGVPDGEFRVNVSLAFANGGYANDTQLIVGGVAKSGHWEGQWRRQGEDGETWVGFDTYFTGRTAEIIPLNPGLMVVFFTFIEDPPVNFFGKMTTTKKLGTTTPSTGDVGGANVRITNSINGWYYDATSNPFTLGNLNVCESNPLSFNCGAAKYKNTVTVPSGYKVASVNVTYPTPPPTGWPNAPASSSFSCTGGNGTGDCSVSNLWVWWGGNYPSQTQLETGVVWNFVASSTGTTPAYKYPWLQTTQGNVVANGKITGQVSGSNTAYPGSRDPNNLAKEAEFLIISKVGGGGPFCSNKNYILTNDSATGGDCGNGSGYSVLNVDSVAGTEDKVVAGVKAAYDTLDAACKTIADTASLSTLSGLLNKSATDCPNGVIIKFNTGNVTLSYSFMTARNRITLLVEGDLTILDNINYGTTGYANPKNVPNLAFVVKGNIGVSQSVTKVDASMYATGTISTCEVATTNLCPPSSLQLVVNGFMSAQQGFGFGRVYTNDSLRSAAEIINLTLQSVVYPPPGIDYNSVFKGDSSVKIDSSEYPPRF